MRAKGGARLAGEGGEWRYLDARQEAHLEVMQRFRCAVGRPAVRTRQRGDGGAFIAADRARDRHELKRLSTSISLSSSRNTRRRCACACRQTQRARARDWRSRWDADDRRPT